MIFPVEMAGNLAVVTINRPPVNAINSAFIAELTALAERLNSDPQVRAVLFRSAITGRFIAGADLADVAPGGEAGSGDGGEAGSGDGGEAGSGDGGEAGDSPIAVQMRHANQAWRRAFNALEQVAVPTVAAISGHCLGGGLEFALCCDFRLMVDDGRALIGLTETNLGLFPGAGGTVRLPRVVGVSRAKDLIYRGRRLAAQEALAFGLVDGCWGPDRFEAEAMAFAAALAAGPTQALRYAKAAIQAGLTDPQQADQIEEDGFTAVVQTEDVIEGLTAFWEKRPPQFKGR